MNRAPRKIEGFAIEFDEERIWRHIGYKKKSKEIKESLKKIIDSEKKRLGYLLEAKAIYRILPYEKTDKHPIFQNAEKVGLCVCTIGPKLEQESAKLMRENEILRALILDALGSEAVEEVANQANIIVAEEGKRMNLRPSKRFSPGFGEWNIKEQSFIFQVLPADQIGVMINEAFMMIPRKSISFRINFFKK